MGARGALGEREQGDRGVREAGAALNEIILHMYSSIKANTDSNPARCSQQQRDRRPAARLQGPETTMQIAQLQPRKPSQKLHPSPTQLPPSSIRSGEHPCIHRLHEHRRSRQQRSLPHGSKGRTRPCRSRSCSRENHRRSSIHRPYNFLNHPHAVERIPASIDFMSRRRAAHARPVQVARVVDTRSASHPQKTSFPPRSTLL